MNVNTRLRIETESDTYDRVISGTRYYIVNRSNLPKFFCGNCDELIKSDRPESERGKPYICCKCYEYMDRVKSFDTID